MMKDRPYTRTNLNLWK